MPGSAYVAAACRRFVCVSDTSRSLVLVFVLKKCTKKPSPAPSCKGQCGAPSAPRMLSPPLSPLDAAFSSHPTLQTFGTMKGTALFLGLLALCAAGAAAEWVKPGFCKERDCPRFVMVRAQGAGVNALWVEQRFRSEGRCSCLCSPAALQRAHRLLLEASKKRAASAALCRAVPASRRPVMCSCSVALHPAARSNPARCCPLAQVEEADGYETRR